MFWNICTSCVFIIDAEVFYVNVKRAIRPRRHSMRNKKGDFVPYEEKANGIFEAMSCRRSDKADADTGF